MHLTNQEDLAYRRAVDFYYDTEKPIPLETQWVSRRLRVDTKDLESILNDFFIKTDDGWIHERCDAELEKYRQIVQRNKANGNKGGRPKTQKSTTYDEKITQNNPVGYDSVATSNPKKPTLGNQEPITNNQEPIKEREMQCENHDDLFDSNISSIKKIKRPAAIPQSSQDVSNYMLELNVLDHHMQAESFFDFYSANGWVVGKAKASMKDWKAAARNWLKNNFHNQYSCNSQAIVIEQQANSTTLNALHSSKTAQTPNSKQGQTIAKLQAMKSTNGGGTFHAKN